MIVAMGLLPDRSSYGLRMHRECRERFPRHRGLAIPTCNTARASRTCRDACLGQWAVQLNRYGNNDPITQFHISCRIFKFVHSVESPSMVDPQWDIWYWGSKWNLHTVCWSAVGCEWGTTSVYFGITYVCFIPSRRPVFAVEPQYLFQEFFIFVKSIIWRTHTKSSKNFMLV